MVSTLLLDSKFSSPCANSLVTVPRAPITSNIIITFIFHIFFNSLARFRYLSFFSLSFNFTLWSARTAKSTIRQVLFFLLIVIRSSCLTEIRSSVRISKSLKSLLLPYCYHHHYYFYYWFCCCCCWCSLKHCIFSSLL